MTDKPEMTVKALLAKLAPGANIPQELLDVVIAQSQHVERLESELTSANRKLLKSEAAKALLQVQIVQLEAMRVDAQRAYIEEHSDGVHDCVTPYDYYYPVDISVERLKASIEAEAVNRAINMEAWGAQIGYLNMLRAKARGED